MNSIELSIRSSVTVTRPAAQDLHTCGPQEFRGLVRRAVLDHHALERYARDSGGGPGRLPAARSHPSWLSPGFPCSRAGRIARCRPLRRFGRYGIDSRRAGNAGSVSAPETRRSRRMAPLTLSPRIAAPAGPAMCRCATSLLWASVTASPAPVGVGQPRHWPRAARRFDAEQLLTILQLDTAIERWRGVQGCQHRDRGAGRRASFHVGERPERTACGYPIPSPAAPARTNHRD